MKKFEWHFEDPQFKLWMNADVTFLLYLFVLESRAWLGFDVRGRAVSDAEPEDGYLGQKMTELGVKTCVLGCC